MKQMMFVIVLLALLLSGCGAQSAPAASSVQVEASAAAVSNTMVALTEAAVPTETAAPPTNVPTDTPQPTPTIPPLPTSLILASPTTAPVSSSSGDPCSGPISTSKGETMGKFLVQNHTNQLITVSFHMQKKNPFGDCGYWSTVISANGSSDIRNLPNLSCFDVYAFSQTGKPDWQHAWYGLCNGYNTDKFRIQVSTTNIAVQAP